MKTLLELGLDPYFENQVSGEELARLQLGRVVEEQKNSYFVQTAAGELLAEVTGKFRHDALGRADFPAVGDWVLLSPRPSEGRATIHRLLDRRSRLSRKTAGVETSEQIIAANVDTVLIVASANDDLNVRRLERYLTLAWDGGCVPVIVLTKADLCENPGALLEEIARSAPYVAVHSVSARLDQGREQLQLYLAPGKTVCLVGSSGVGKSTLVNWISGRDLQAVQAIRETDDKGKHTTTARSLFVLPDGGLIIDTPGMRELQMWDGEAGLERAFDEIVEWARSCRFTDCRHEAEPGCAVRMAIEEGALEESRLSSYLKLKREAAYVDRKSDKRLQAEEKKRWKKIHIANRQRDKSRF